MNEQSQGLDPQEARFIADKVKPFIDAEVAASPTMKTAAKEMTNQAIKDAEQRYPAESSEKMEPEKAEIIAYRAKPSIDVAAESSAVARAAEQAEAETRDKLYYQLQPEDDNEVLSHPAYVAAQGAARAASDVADHDSELANHVIDTLDKSYETPEGR